MKSRVQPKFIALVTALILIVVVGVIFIRHRSITLTVSAGAEGGATLNSGNHISKTSKNMLSN